jgi:hypothetical protein
MKLADLRKIAIRKTVQIRFRMGNGKDCLINDHGIAQVPGWTGIPDFSLEDEVASASEFTLEPVVPPNAKNPPKPRRVSRQELIEMTSEGSATVAAAEHEEE